MARPGFTNGLVARLCEERRRVVERRAKSKRTEDLEGNHCHRMEIACSPTIKNRDEIRRSTKTKSDRKIPRHDERCSATAPGTRKKYFGQIEFKSCANKNRVYVDTLFSGRS